MLITEKIESIIILFIKRILHVSKINLKNINLLTLLYLFNNNKFYIFQE